MREREEGDTQAIAQQIILHHGRVKQSTESREGGRGRERVLCKYVTRRTKLKLKLEKNWKGISMRVPSKAKKELGDPRVGGW